MKKAVLFCCADQEKEVRMPQEFFMLQDLKIPVFMPELAPANDGGIAYGQIIEAVHSSGMSNQLERI